MLAGRDLWLAENRGLVEDLLLSVADKVFLDRLTGYNHSGEMTHSLGRI